MENPERAEARVDAVTAAARAAAVIRRTVRFGLESEAHAISVRYLDATCQPWLTRIPAEQLDPSVREIVEQLRVQIGGWREDLSLGARKDLFEQIGGTAVRLQEHLQQQGSAPGVPAEPRIRLLPEGQRLPRNPPGPPRPAPAAEGAEGPADPTEGSGAPPQTDPDPASESSGGRARRSSSRRRRGRRSRRTGGSRSRRASTARKSTERRESEPAPPEVRRLPLGHPEGTGQRIGDWTRLPPPLARALEKAGLKTVADLLRLAPARYELLPRAVAPSELLAEDTRQVIRGTVLRRFSRLTPYGGSFEVVVGDGQDRVVCRWVLPVPDSFRQQFSAGSRVSLYGRVEHDESVVLLHEGEPVSVDSRGRSRQPVYEVPGLDDAEARRLLFLALEHFRGSIQDPLPAEIREKHRLLHLEQALERTHRPGQGHERGPERLAFDELLLYQLGVGLRRRRGSPARGIAHTPSHKLMSRIQLARGITLDDPQEIAFSEIRRDLFRPRQMNRLLQGEVGTGKGLVSLLCAVIVAEGRHQVLVVAPDALAAEHRFLFAEPLLRSVGLIPLLVPGPPGTAQSDAMRRGEVHVVFGTPELLRARPHFKRLGLVTVEERGAYGTVTIDDLPCKGARPDLLVMTAAPIPSSLALTVFGGMDLSVVAGPGIGQVQTRICLASERREAYEQVREELEGGRQAYVVFPLVRGEEQLELKDLARLVEALRSEAFPGARIGVFTGRKSREERQRIFDDFRHRRLDVLVTTTIIEDSPVVPSATALVVEQAHRFDLVRLHRLRAHVGRGARPGRCFLVLPDGSSETDRASHVELVCRETDGFRIAELDLAERGAEALLGGRAREVPEFRHVDPLGHRWLLGRARAEAFDLLDRDPGLVRSPHEQLKRDLEEDWHRWFPGKPAFPGRGRRRRGGRSGGRRRRRDARTS